MTLNSFTSVSLDPMLVLVSLAHGSRTLEAVRASGRFAISILQRGQRQIALDFADAGGRVPRTSTFAQTRLGFYPVRQALAELYCDVQDIVAAGDHDLVIGHVRRVHLDERASPSSSTAASSAASIPTSRRRSRSSSSSTRGSAGERAGARRGRRRAGLGPSGRATRSSLDDGRRIPEADAVYLAPAEPTKIIAVHLTYRSRIEEYRARTPAEPSYFMKPPTTLNGHRGVDPQAEGIALPQLRGRARRRDRAADEGRPRGRGPRLRRPASAARTTSACTTSATPTGARCSASRDRTASCRSAPSSSRPPTGTRPATRCARTVNGEVVQEATQDDVIWPVEYQLADLCRLITLEPGDVVLTGTPANSRPMEVGDVVEVEITGLGRLTNTVVDWDVDLSGPGEQMQVSANTLHVALAIPEDEAERLVAEGRLEP